MGEAGHSGGFPAKRLRRLRRSGAIRDAVADVALVVDCLVCPLFVGDMDRPEAVESMPGVSRLPVKEAVDTVRELSGRGLRQFILFGVTDPSRKDPGGGHAMDESAPVNRVLRAVREAGVEAVLYADLCLCEYTDHGHCGVVSEKTGRADGWVVDNDRTLEVLGKTAVVLAGCGADVVAPSGMMDGQVGAVRSALDRGGFEHVAVMSYSVKYASGFYGPFREAGGGGMKFGDRRGYQMDPRRSREWRLELEQDLAEGADIVMVKPAGACLDIVRGVRESCGVPVAAYHVSGEYAMLCAASQRGWLDLKEAALEVTYGIRRAGADLIVTYFAPQLAQWLKG